jgi:hypothetical protein
MATNQATGFNIQTGTAVDNRQIYDTVEDVFKSSSQGGISALRRYDGLDIWIRDEAKLYRFIGGTTREHFIAQNNVTFENFDEAATYAIGQMVLYDGSLFRFTEEKEPGVWDAEKVTSLIGAGAITVNEVPLVNGNVQIIWHGTEDALEELKSSGLLIEGVLYMTSENETLNHGDLAGRDAPNAHPIGAISGLDEALEDAAGTKTVMKTQVEWDEIVLEDRVAEYAGSFVVISDPVEAPTVLYISIDNIRQGADTRRLVANDVSVKTVSPDGSQITIEDLYSDVETGALSSKTSIFSSARLGFLPMTEHEIKITTPYADQQINAANALIAALQNDVEDLPNKADKYNYYLPAITLGGPMQNLTLDLDVVLADPNQVSSDIHSEDGNFSVLKDWSTGQLNETYTHNGIVDELIVDGVITGDHQITIHDVWNADEITGTPTPNAWFVVYSVKEVVDLMGQWVHLRGPARDLVEAVTQRVRFVDTKEEATLYLDSHATEQPTADIDGNHSIFHKYTTIADLQGSSRWNDHVTVKFSAGSDTSNEGIVLHNQNGAALYSESAPDVISVKVGSILLSGTTDEVTLSGLTLVDTFTLGSNGTTVVAQSTNFLGEVVAAASGLPVTNGLIRSFEKCRFEHNITLNGEAEVEYGFYDCWAYADINGNYPTITLNNPNAVLIIDGTTALKMGINIVQCKRFELNGATINSLAVEGDCDVILKSGLIANPDDETELVPITLNNSGLYILGNTAYRHVGSTLGQNYKTLGVDSLQVREVQERAGFTPRIDPSDGTNRTPGVDAADTIRDQLNGISDAIVGLMGGQAGIASGGLSDNSTAINFYPDTANTGDEYALFQLPLNLFGVYAGDENSIHLNTDGTFSVILTSGPILEALNGKVSTEVGKGLSTNDYSALDKAKLGSLATINAVTAANGLSLSAGTLAMEDVWSAPIALKQDKITATGVTNLLLAPASQGGQPTTKPVSDFATSAQGILADDAQPKITSTGTTNLLTAPAASGGNPGTKAINTLLAAPAAQTAGTQLLLAPATKGDAPTLLPVAPLVQRQGIASAANGTYTILNDARRIIQFTTMGSGSGRRFIRLYKVNTDGHNKARMKVTSRYIWSTQDIVWSQAAANTAPTLIQGGMQWDSAITRFHLFLGNDGYMWIDYDTSDLGGMKLILDVTADDQTRAEVLFSSNVPTAVGASVDLRTQVVRKTYVTANGLTFSYQRSGNVVYCQCSGNQLTAGIASYGTMATIPVGYRPSIQSPQQDSIYHVAAVNTAGTNRPVGFQIYTGLVRPMEALANASYVIAGWSWITDDAWTM